MELWELWDPGKRRGGTKAQGRTCGTGGVKGERSEGKE